MMLEAPNVAAAVVSEGDCHKVCRHIHCQHACRGRVSLSCPNMVPQLRQNFAARAGVANAQTNFLTAGTSTGASPPPQELRYDMSVRC